MSEDSDRSPSKKSGQRQKVRVQRSVSRPPPQRDIPSAITPPHLTPAHRPVLSRKPASAQDSPPHSAQTSRLELNFSRIPSSTPTPYQSKLRVNAPGDHYEQEADQVANAVMRMADPSLSPARSAPLALQRMPVQRSGSEPASVPPATERTIERMDGGGAPLPAGERSFFESRMGVDFSHVRVHTDTTAVQTSRDLGARAFTVGNNIAFNTGEYQPATQAGRQLMAHELTHVVQQQGGQQVQRKHESGIPSVEPARAILTIQQVAFTDSHKMNSTDAINDTWTLGITNHVIAYTRNELPQVDTIFKVASKEATSTQLENHSTDKDPNLHIRVLQGNIVLAQVEQQAKEQVDIQVSGIMLGQVEKLPQSNLVGKQSYLLTWEWSENGTVWNSAGTSGSHLLFWLYGSPREKRISAIQEAVTAAQGKDDVQDIARALRQRVSVVRYDPSDTPDDDPLAVWLSKKPKGQVCADFAHTLEIFASAIGLDATVVLIAGGFITNTTDGPRQVWVTDAKGNSLIDVPNYSSPFIYHAITKIEGVYHDAALKAEGPVKPTIFRQGDTIGFLEVKSGLTLPNATQDEKYNELIEREEHKIELHHLDVSTEVAAQNPAYQLQASDLGETVPINWKVIAGDLPKGMKLGSDNGKIKGKPEEAGTYQFTIQLTSRSDASEKKIVLSNQFRLTLIVNPGKENKGKGTEAEVSEDADTN